MVLGTTAGGLFWMFRYLERSENTARLIEAGQRIALTRSADAENEWASIITTAGATANYDRLHDQYSGPEVVDFLLRDRTNPSSVASVVDAARNNARLSRTALTREVWQATNDCWLRVTRALENPIPDSELPEVLELVRHESAVVRGALHGTMLRNDIYDFARLGTFIERADNTARILDVKYYVLLPSAQYVGSRLDNVQWETILRCLSAQRSYRWKSRGNPTTLGIAQFAILDRAMPRSLAFSFDGIVANLGYLADDYGDRRPSHAMADELNNSVANREINDIFDQGLHEFLQTSIRQIDRLANQITIDYRFTK